MDGKSNALKKRITSVKNTRRITEAMRLVAAAKVRRAQEAVLNSRPFVEALQRLFGNIITQLGKEDIQLPLLEQRPVKNVCLVVITGDRGLCGAYNSAIIKAATIRARALQEQGLDVSLVTIGNKASQFFRRRNIPIRRSFAISQTPDADFATKVTEELLAEFLSEEVDAVEVVYTRFVNLITSEPSFRTILPLRITGIESEGDEVFSLTTQGGQFAIKTEEIPVPKATAFEEEFIFEQDPVQILNALLPLYLDGQVLRMMQESVASELAARMTAMQSASNNAKSLVLSLSQIFNRARQSSVTQEILEIAAGASALEDA